MNSKHGNISHFTVCCLTFVVYCFTSQSMMMPFHFPCYFQCYRKGTDIAKISLIVQRSERFNLRVKSKDRTCHFKMFLVTQVYYVPVLLWVDLSGSSCFNWLSLWVRQQWNLNNHRKWILYDEGCEKKLKVHFLELLSPHSGHETNNINFVVWVTMILKPTWFPLVIQCSKSPWFCLKNSEVLK